MAGYMLPHHPFFAAYLEQVRRFLGPDWTPKRLGRDGCGLPTMANTVAELSQLFSGLAATREEDWIWEAMQRHPDLVGGFNRLDSTIIKSCEGAVLAKEGADGLLGMAIVHPDYPEGLGVVVKIAHGWNSQATWYIARSILDLRLRTPKSLLSTPPKSSSSSSTSSRQRFENIWNAFQPGTSGTQTATAFTMIGKSTWTHQSREKTNEYR